jgi:hypothetical protein
MTGITGALTGLGSSAKELVANTWGMATGSSNSPVDMGASVMGEPLASVRAPEIAAPIQTISEIANNIQNTLSSLPDHVQGLVTAMRESPSDLSPVNLSPEGNTAPLAQALNSPITQSTGVPNQQVSMNV